ncbi:MAG: YitT family protein, partial [Candidatus Nanopelagicales bacterium]|nr:YitT family protein [Candidatus Nanopelagicales bacterium]
MKRHIPQWLFPSKIIPVTPWRSNNYWVSKPSTIFILVVGLWLFGTGEAFLISANSGVSPWTVFAQGISVQTGLSIGWATFFSGIGVLALWIPLKQKPGLGTVLNIIIISIALEVMSNILPTPTSDVLQVIQILVGIAIVGLGSGFYLTCHMGPGPRDGLMTRIHLLTGLPVGRVRLFIEISVLTIGWLLG